MVSRIDDTDGGELTGLRRRDISPDGTAITVSVELTRIKIRIELDSLPKAAAGKRTVTLPKIVAAAVVDHLDHIARRALGGDQ